MTDDTKTFRMRGFKFNHLSLVSIWSLVVAGTTSGWCNRVSTKLYKTLQSLRLICISHKKTITYIRLFHIYHLSCQRQLTTKWKLGFTHTRYHWKLQEGVHHVKATHRWTTYIAYNLQDQAIGLRLSENIFSNRIAVYFRPKYNIVLALPWRCFDIQMSKRNTWIFISAICEESRNQWTLCEELKFFEQLRFQEYNWSTDILLPRCRLMERTSREHQM